MSHSQRITPRTLKGFRDYPPETMIPREWIIDTARRVYRRYGFAPIDTPALEYLEVLTGKGSDETDKQLYRFEDHGGRQVGLRFDLTVPLARFAAQHAGQIGLPFKRYHIAPVWRGENTQRGRYREFVQCDFDTLGVTGPAADAETVLVVHDLLQALGLERFTIRINHRSLLNGLLDTFGLGRESAAVLRALDKLAKAGRDKVGAELVESAGATPDQAERLLNFASIEGEPDEVLDSVRAIVGDHKIALEAISRLSTVLEVVATRSERATRVSLDPSIARGLDYYTGLVLETTLDELPEIGSVASGGRYDNLTGVYSSQPMPGIGASLGVDRLLAAMEELDLLNTVATTAQVLVVLFSEQHLADSAQIADELRSHDFDVELYPEPKKLAKQLQYADRRGFRLAVIAGPDELASDRCQIKDLQTGQSQLVPRFGLIGAARDALALGSASA